MMALLDGLTDTTLLGQRLTLLERNPRVTLGRKHETEDDEQQRALEHDVVRMLARLDDGNPAERNNVLEETGKAISQLRSRDLHEKNPEKKRVLERATSGLFVFLMETAEPLIDSKDPGLARIYLELAVEARPESSWPQFSLARCFLKMGKKKDALQALKHAREAGLSSEDLIGLAKNYPEFSAIVSEPEYRKLTSSLATNPLQ
jgi:predicted Zn-dependent protease